MVMQSENSDDSFGYDTDPPSEPRDQTLGWNTTRRIAWAIRRACVQRGKPDSISGQIEELICQKKLAKLLADDDQRKRDLQK